MGMFSASAQLVEHMQRDDRVFATLTSRVMALTGLDFSIEPASSDEASTVLTEKVQAWWMLAMPESALSEFLRWGVMLGVALAEVTWVIEEGQSIPTVKVWHPQFLRWDQALRKWYVITEDAGEIEVTPGNGWILWLPFGERSWMQGAVRALAIPWLGRQWGYRDWFRRSEVEGNGIIKAKVPGEVDNAKATKWLNSLRNLGREAVVKCPEGFDIDIMTAKPGTADFFGKLIASCDSAITLVLLGQNLTTQVEGGSLAAAQVHSRVQRERTKADAESLSTGLRTQLLVPWGLLNIAGFVATMAPWPRWDTAEPADTKTEAEVLQVLSLTLGTLGNAGVPVDTAALAARFNLPLLTGSDVSKVSGQIYQYHLQFGVVSKNELRSRLGFPPVADGDAPPQPLIIPQVASAIDGDTPITVLGLPPGPVALRSAPSRKGFVSGQVYVDELADNAEAATVKGMASFTARVLAAIESGEDYDEIKARMLKILDESDVDQTAPIVEHSGVLATLAGRLSVKEDL